MSALLYMRIIIFVAVIIFLIGIYKNLFKRIIQILLAQELVQDEKRTNRIFSFFRLALNEVIVQRRIKKRSQIVWIRHLMIFGGFVTFFLIELLIGITKNYQSFTSIRPILKIGLNLSGFFLLLGLTIALIHRIIHRKEEKEFTDIKSLVLLFAVVISGLLSSGCRTLLSPESANMVNSSVKHTIFGLLRFFPYPLEDLHYWLYLVHITIAAAVVAYIPFSKLVHMFAVPIGRMATMSEDSADRKRARVAERLLLG
jgi:nitrate reductase gamma subunit